MLKQALIIPALFALCSCSMHSPSQQAMVPSTVTGKPVEHFSFLRTEGRHIVDETGNIVQLRGSNAGNWLLIEPWIICLDGQAGIESEKDIWDLMEKRFGKETKLDLIRCYRDNFFTEKDVERMAATGMNCLRLPIWWRAVSDPDYGGDIAYIDRAIEWCEKHGLYVIIDLHGTPGGQSDNAKIVGERTDADLWKDYAYQRQTIAWWLEIAERYKDNPVVAGYDLINEATGAKMHELISLYHKIYERVREIDTKHIIFLEDGLLGWHRMPLPSDYGWENVVYSFHYYPQDPEEAFKADSEILHRFNRAGLYYNVPVYVGEFNTMHYERGGLDTFLRYCEVFDYYGWSWTFWTYKKIEDDMNICWGLYGYYYEERPRIDLHHDTAEQIKQGFIRMNTDYTKVHPLFKGALSADQRFSYKPVPALTQTVGIRADLAEAMIIPVHGGMKTEWQWTPPNIGYWTHHNILAWYIDVKEAGPYEMGIHMADASDENLMRLWIDGVLATDAKLPNTGWWRIYKDCSLGTIYLSEGRHCIEMEKTGSSHSFINLQSAWFEPSTNEPQPLNESIIRLSVLNVNYLNPCSRIRGEWFNDPPNFGYWHNAEFAVWKKTLQKGGDYSVEIEFASENPSTAISILVNDTPVLTAPLAGSENWTTFKKQNIGDISLPAGTSNIKVVWKSDDIWTACGNMRAITMTKKQ